MTIISFNIFWKQTLIIIKEYYIALQRLYHVLSDMWSSLVVSTIYTNYSSYSLGNIIILRCNLEIILHFNFLNSGLISLENYKPYKMN